MVETTKSTGAAQERREAMEQGAQMELTEVTRQNRQFAPEMIIWSADVPREDIERVVRAGALPEGSPIKLDRLFFETEDKNFIEWLQERGYPVFGDAKIIEIPSKVLAITSTYLVHRPWMLNIMAGACSTGVFTADDEDTRDLLARFADECRKVGTRSCAVTVLTSKSLKLVEDEFGRLPINQVMKYAEMARRAGMTDLVCSPAEVTVLRKSGYNDVCLNTPGVRPAGSILDDQRRVSTPGQAISDGATRIVVGRPLLAGNGPIEERVAHNYAMIRNEIVATLAQMDG